MNIDFTKEQYEDLLCAILVANDVYGIVGDIIESRKEDSLRIERLREYILGYAENIGLDKLVERYMGTIIPSDSFSEKIDEIVQEYDDETFWHELETLLGKRDFERTMTKEEWKQIKKNHGLLPERIHDCYDKWLHEFEKYGIERLIIDEGERAKL